jgi:hypothetical protein
LQKKRIFLNFFKKPGKTRQKTTKPAAPAVFARTAATGYGLKVRLESQHNSA